MSLERFEFLYEHFCGLSRRQSVYEFNRMSVPDRKEFLKYLFAKSEELYDDFIDDLRDIAIQDFWTNERQLIEAGSSTRNWMPEQIESIFNISLETGNKRVQGGAAIYLDVSGGVVTKRHGTEEVPEVYEVHQMLSVNAYPEYAGIYKNMQALARSNGEHLRAHRGMYQNTTCWYYDYTNGSYHKIGG